MKFIKILCPGPKKTVVVVASLVNYDNKLTKHAAK